MKKEEIKKREVYDFELEELKDKIRAMASNEIYRAKCKTYVKYASNDLEGDYGTWNDWFILIANFGIEVMEMFVEEKKK